MTFRVVAVDSRKKARLVMVRKGQVAKLGTSFTVWEALAADRTGWLNAKQAAQALKWVKAKGWSPYVAKDGEFPFVRKEDNGVTMPGDKHLLRKLNELGRRRKRLVIVVSGYRDDHAQWVLRMRYLRGQGNNAARCCLKYDWEQHSWHDCGKQSQSNHSQPPRGHAVDCGLLLPRGYESIGDCGRKVRRIMRDLGLCLPVPGEAWHTEVGSVWRA